MNALIQSIDSAAWPRLTRKYQYRNHRRFVSILPYIFPEGKRLCVTDRPAFTRCTAVVTHGGGCDEHSHSILTRNRPQIIPSAPVWPRPTHDRGWAGSAN